MLDYDSKSVKLINTLLFSLKVIKFGVKSWLALRKA